MAKDNVSQWDLNPDGNTDVGGNNIAENCPPSSINNAIRSVMAQIKGWYNNVPRLDANNTYSGSNTFNGASSFEDPVTAPQFVSSVASTVPNNLRGFSSLVDGAQQFQIYYDNLKTVLSSQGLGFFTQQTFEISGRSLKLSSGSISAPVDRGIRFLVDGVQYGSFYRENGGLLTTDTGYHRTVIGSDEITRVASSGYGIGKSVQATLPDDAGPGVWISKTGLVWSSRDSAPAGLFKRTASDGVVIQLARNATAVGSISVTDSGTSFNTTSDERLKQDFRQISPQFIDKINVYDFAWRNGSGRGYGVKAQELAATYPSAVTKGESEQDMWGVDYSRLVPFLIAAVKDLRARVAELEGK